MCEYKVGKKYYTIGKKKLINYNQVFKNTYYNNIPRWLND